jgi:3',5'-cyclic-AMP phosphodiesterase
MWNKSPSPIYNAVVFVCLLSCNKFEYNPYQTVHINKPENLNAVNLTRLLTAEHSADDTVTILFTGDSQRFYNSLDALITKCNSIPGIDMLVLAGDISDYGLLQEFLWIYERLELLNVPYLCVVGNHDLTSNGSFIYNRIFGPKNFSFYYKNYKFLFHDTNGREYNFNGNVPDLNWMAYQLNDPVPSWFVGISHVPPYNSDFDSTLEIPYKNLLSSTENFILSLNGHLHEGGDSFFYDDHVRYITSFSVNNNECILLKLINGTIIKEIIYY